MKNQKGITLVALVITIIVMIILAGVAISFISGENGILNKAKVAGDTQNYATAEEKIKIQFEYIIEGENAGKIDLLKTESNIRNLNLEEVKDIIPTTNLLTIVLNDDTKIEIPGVNGKNEYGFYYNVEYVCNNYFSDSNTNFVKVKLLEDGTYIAYTYQDRNYIEGQTVNVMDITNTYILSTNSWKYDEEFSKEGAFDSVCTYRIDRNGDLFSTHVIKSDKITYSYKNVNIGGVLNCVASEDGKSFVVSGKVFEIEK